MKPFVALVALAACTAGVEHGVVDELPPDAAIDVSPDAAPPDAPLPAPDLAPTLAALAADVATRSPGTDLAIAFVDLQTGTRAAIAGDSLHVSASSAKAWWVAAALDGAGLDAVAPYATAIFASSDNYASGAVIDLIGPNAVNTWMWNAAGMTSSALTQWSFGAPRVATNSPRAMGSDNYATANDAVTFLARLHRRELLADARGAALLDWMTLAPRNGLGGWLAARLPEPAASAAAHKAGWLPPGCCSNDGYYNTLDDIGIVTAPDGRAYAVAIYARRGADYWGRQAPFIEYASCEIYKTFARDAALVCGRAGDLTP